MNYRGKNKLFILLGLALVQIVSIAIFLIVRPNNSLPIILMFTVILLIALAGALFSYIALKKIEKRIKDLPESYQRVYIDASEVIGISAMKRNEKENTMNMILEIFEHANIEERSIEDVIGDDLKSFINGFIEVSGGKASFLYMISYSFFIYLIYLLVMKFYKVIRIGNVSLNALETQNLDVALVVLYGLIAFIFFPWMLFTVQKAGKEQWTGIKRIRVLLPFIIPIGLVILLISVDQPDFITLIDKPVPLLDSIPKIGIAFALTILSFVLMKYAQKRQLKNSSL